MLRGLPVRPNPSYRAWALTSKVTLKLAEELLDRFFREAEGQANRSIDLVYLLDDMRTNFEKAEPALEYLASRGLITTYTGDAVMMSEHGIDAIAKERDIKILPKYQPEWGGAPAGVTAQPSAPPRPYRPALSYADPEGKMHTVELGWMVVVGRSDEASMKIPDPRASKKHIEVRYAGDCYVVRDLGSANGTMVNGNYVDSFALHHGDKILVGRTELFYACPEVIPEPAGEPPPEFPKKKATSAPAPASTLRPAKEPAPAPRSPSQARAPRDRPASDAVRVVKGEPAAPSRAGAPSRPAAGNRPAPSAASDPFAGLDAAPPRGADLFGPPLDNREPDDLFAPRDARPTGDLFAPNYSTQEAPDLFEATVLRPPKGAPPAEEAVPIEHVVAEGASPLGQPEDVSNDATISAPSLLLSGAPGVVITDDEGDTNLDSPGVRKAAQQAVDDARKKKKAKGDLAEWGASPPPRETSHPPFDAFEETTPVESHGTSAGVSQIFAATADLPEAPPDFAEHSLTPQEAPRSHTVPFSSFNETLQVLRARIAEAGPPDADRLLDAIDTLRKHPSVRSVLGG